jgi:cytochrome b pre-mRNA-processing protein 3
MLSAIKKLFTPDPVQQQAHEAYVAVVSQARDVRFFRDWKVEDTLDGRFDVIVLHVCMVIARLEKEPQAPRVKEFIRVLSEVFFSDMDRSLRELGASDTGVGKRINKMAQAFYGRLKAYNEALAAGDITEAISRNIYRDKAPETSILSAWQGYAQSVSEALAGQSAEQLMQGRILFSR